MAKTDAPTSRKSEVGAYLSMEMGRKQVEIRISDTWLFKF